ncbi:hypothetical protein MUN81_15360 [Hymenobacter sp. 5317J-9]|uniref:hypothetical protein n=1 Tax=Hymenobacter sp. 5317J-9 TaxID=2932250 RepID=UPI001FD72410|nr:hypothetical protein [Hymenobacter sp. 5317J-9]UOQ96613.1 hypothetical protein MUN81_15360 [Hymenobacter sp. 5317J-9]
MDVTSLPTESLYKFMAFAGLIIIFGTAAYAYKFLTAIGKQLITVQTDVAVFQVKSAKYREGVLKRMAAIKSEAADIMGIQLGELEKELISVRTTDNNPVGLYAGKNFSPEAQELFKKMSANREIVDDGGYELDIISAELAGKIDLLAFETRQERLLKIGCVISILVGSVLTYYGFKHWAVMQDYADRVLIKEAIDKLK